MSNRQTREVKNGYRAIFKNALRDSIPPVLPFPSRYRRYFTVGDLAQAVDTERARECLALALQSAIAGNDAQATGHLMQFIAEAADWYGEAWADAWEAEQEEAEGASNGG